MATGDRRRKFGLFDNGAKAPTKTWDCDAISSVAAKEEVKILRSDSNGPNNEEVRLQVGQNVSEIINPQEMTTSTGKCKFGLFVTAGKEPTQIWDGDKKNTVVTDWFEIRRNDGGARGNAVVAVVRCGPGQEIRPIIEPQDSKPDPNKGRCMANSINVGDWH
jgi:hypothetical protein